ncbi:zinc-dependent alcohol dehydrogenase [Vagococcus acidifermentans]|uniref:Alcohol dehydrogenase n=1 Tax=Vagococcus acidifermentans TaxID=564710 RepID=A0A430AQB3_9ENTE|nr:alcohol dehydrogenase catalytic domain-containing protein [Vagococcus acidifermentans]RSU10124.1 alcohol dehydrogenase [Vagococcus acidifermentans]
MKTAVFEGIEKIKIEEYDIQKIPDDKILIKIEACAICTWEQRVYTGVKQVEFPFIGGHEIAAEIVGLGKKINEKIWHIGDKVVYGTNLACGDCYYCKTGQEQNCLYFDHSKQLEGLPHKGMGGLSEYMLANPKHLFHYDTVTPEEAALSEPLSCVIHSCETADIQYGDVVVVIGCGIMGLLHVSLAAKSGAIVVACDLKDDRLALSRTVGASYTINTKEQNLYDEVMKLTDQIGANVVFDTTPISELVDDAVAIVANLGKVVLYSSFYPDTPVSLSPDRLHKNSYQLLGTANSNSRDFMRSTRLISKGVIDVKPFISEVYDFEEVEQAFKSAVKGDKYRVVVKF